MADVNWGLGTGERTTKIEIEKKRENRIERQKQRKRDISHLREDAYYIPQLRDLWLEQEDCEGRGEYSRYRWYSRRPESTFRLDDKSIFSEEFSRKSGTKGPQLELTLL